MSIDSISQHHRQSWIAVLAKANWPDLQPLWISFQDQLTSKILRKPETGLVMLRGRMGGSGQPFNTGEATVPRCTVESGNGIKGHSYILGRNKDHALAAASIDAGLQHEDMHATLMNEIIKPLETKKALARETHRRKVAATKVDFFTMVRGEDE